MGDHNTQFLKGVLSMLLLRLLTDKEDYGYSVVVRLQKLGFENLREGTVYPALTRLERKNWLESRLVPSDSGPARKYYQPTTAGVAELRREETAWAEFVENIHRVVQPRRPVGAPQSREGVKTA